MGKMNTFGETGLKKGERIQVLTQMKRWRADETEQFSERSRGGEIANFTDSKARSPSH